MNPEQLGPEPEAPNAPPMQTIAAGPGSDEQVHQTTSALDKLKWGILVSALAVLITAIPGGSGLGGLISFIAFVVLLLGWHGLGKSGLQHAGRYATTVWVVVGAFLFVILVGVVGLFQIIMNAESTPGGLAAQAYTAFSEGVELGLVLFTISALGNAYVALSVRKLGGDLAASWVRLAGSLALVSILMSGMGAVGLLAGFWSGDFRGVIAPYLQGQANTSGLAIYDFIFSGNYAILGVAYIVGIATQVAAALLGFAGISKAMDSPARWSTASPPQVPIPTAGSPE